MLSYQLFNDAVMCLDATQVISDKLAVTVIHRSAFGGALSALDLPVFTETSHFHRLDIKCTSR